MAGCPYDLSSRFSIKDEVMLEVAFTQFCFWFITVAFFWLFPSVTKVIFSADMDERRDTKKRKMFLKMQQPQRQQPNTEREFGFRKFACVEEEAIYEPVDIPVYKPVKTPARKPVKTPKPQTSSRIIEDAISALMSVGYKKTEAKKLVNEVCKDKVFSDVIEVIKATMSRTDV